MLQVLEYLLYGLISGLSEIIPASSRGHQSILMILFGMGTRDPMLDMMTHVGILACVIVTCRGQIQYLTGKGRKVQADGMFNRYDRRLIFSATFVMFIGLFFYNMGSKYESRPLALTILFLINAIWLMIPDYIRQCNKNAGQMGPFNSLLIGLSGIISAFPGLSRLGTGCSLAILCGADKQKAFNWLLVLTVPAMIFLLIIDLIGLFTIDLPGISLWLFLGYLIAAAASFIGSYIGIMLMRFIMFNSGMSVFSLYSFGVSLFSFIVYLMAF